MLCHQMLFDTGLEALSTQHSAKFENLLPLRTQSTQRETAPQNRKLFSNSRKAYGKNSEKIQFELLTYLALICETCGKYDLPLPTLRSSAPSAVKMRF